jgi:hypothetical protein
MFLSKVNDKKVMKIFVWPKKHPIFTLIYQPTTSTHSTPVSPIPIYNMKLKKTLKQLE